MAIQIKQNDNSLIKGLHHVTSLASDANVNNHFFTHDLGLRRVKQTVNFDSPDIYHLYYGNGLGCPGTVMTCFPFPYMRQGQTGTGEAGSVVFSIPEKALELWKHRFAELGFKHFSERHILGEKRLSFNGPDGDYLELVENGKDTRLPWSTGQIPLEMAIRGFHSVSLRLHDDGAMAELLRYMGYEETNRKDKWRRFQIVDGNGANTIDIEIVAATSPPAQGAGSVHHVAFAVEDKEAQLTVREALLDTGYAVTPVIDRNYFSAIYFRAPGGVLFEIATNEPGFDKDEDVEHLGEVLKLPKAHEHMKDFLQQHLEPLED